MSRIHVQWHVPSKTTWIQSIINLLTANAKVSFGGSWRPNVTLPVWQSWRHSGAEMGLSLTYMFCRAGDTRARRWVSPSPTCFVELETLGRGDVSLPHLPVLYSWRHSGAEMCLSLTYLFWRAGDTRARRCVSPSPTCFGELETLGRGDVSLPHLPVLESWRHSGAEMGLSLTYPVFARYTRSCASPTSPCSCRYLALSRCTCRIEEMLNPYVTLLAAVATLSQYEGHVLAQALTWFTTNNTQHCYLMHHQ